MSDERNAESDVLLEWLTKGREVLERYYPQAEFGLMVIHIGPDVPDVQLPIIRPTPPESSSPATARAGWP